MTGEFMSSRNKKEPHLNKGTRVLINVNLKVMIVQMNHTISPLRVKGTLKKEKIEPTLLPGWSRMEPHNCWGCSRCRRWSGSVPATSLPLCTGKTTGSTEPTSSHITTHNKHSLEPPKLDKSPARVSSGYTGGNAVMRVGKQRTRDLCYTLPGGERL